jgi:hypothetical protein
MNNTMMPGSSKSDRLLNLVLVARADGDLKPIEVLFLSRKRSELSGQITTLADAVIRSLSEDFIVPYDLINKEHTLFDMIVMALIDGTTDPNEQDLVLNYIDATQLESHRVTSIIRNAITHAQQQRSDIIAELHRYQLPMT